MKASTILTTSLLTATALVMTACQTTDVDGGDAAGPAGAEAAGWQLVFSDDFDRDTLGDDWQVMDGTWEIKDGHLFGSGTLLSSRGFSEDPAYMRMEFMAATEVKPFILMPGLPVPEVSVSDTSSFIHAQDPDVGGTPLRSGYFFQFGGFLNTQSRIRRQGQELVADRTPENMIVPDKLHHVVVENDAGHMRMFVDGELRLEATDVAPLVGEGMDRVGFYFYTAAKVESVRVYAKPVQP